MKTLKAILILATLTTSLIFTSCQKNELTDTQQPENIMPERFKVDIPSSISSAYSYKDAKVDTLQEMIFISTFVHSFMLDSMRQI